MKRTLNDHQLNDYAAKLSTLWKVVAVAVLIAVGLSFTTRADAAVTFSASVTNANGTLSTVLTWASPGANGCTASGHPSFTGAQPATSPVGGFPLPPITLSGTYTLTLSCTKPGDTTATVSWTPPTTNTDGTSLTNLAGYEFWSGITSDVTAEPVRSTSPGQTSKVYTGLSAGPHFFALKACNAVSVCSALTPVVSKMITATAVENGSVTLTVNPIPNSAAGIKVE